MKNNEQRICELLNNFNWPNICVIRICIGGEGRKKYLKKNNALESKNLMKTINPYFKSKKA